MARQLWRAALVAALAGLVAASGAAAAPPPPAAAAPLTPLASAPPPIPPAAGRIEGPYLAVDAATGRVIADHDALRPWFPASTSKLMTIYVTFRAILAGELTLQSPVVYSANAAAQPPSKMWFKPGAVLTLDDALKIMMVKSANDVAVAVAETVGGSVPGFAERMNRESQRLGMTRSHWVTPHGLPDPAQVTTVRDMAVLARALLVEFPQYRDYLKVPAFELGGRVVKNLNPLLERYPGANGMKTGFICASGYNLVASARRGEREVITVVFGEYTGKARAEHAAELLDASFQTDGPGAAPPVTLANVESGQTYTTPLDMRPYVCAPRQAAAASETNMQDDLGAPGAQEQVSHLGPPIYLGPPVAVSVQAPARQAKLGEPGFVARIPRPRPQPPVPGGRAELKSAFAPIAEAIDAAAPPVRAIGALLDSTVEAGNTPTR